MRMILKSAVSNKLGLLLLASALTACGSTNGDGSVASGPLGQTPLMTAEVQMATRQGLNACIDLLSGGVPLSALAGQGFAPWRGGYRIRIDNPLIFAGDSSVSARFDGRDCRVVAGPAYPVEINTIRAIAESELAGRGQGMDVLFRKSGDNLEIILR